MLLLWVQFYVFLVFLEKGVVVVFFLCVHFIDVGGGLYFFICDVGCFFMLEKESSNTINTLSIIAND